MDEINVKEKLQDNKENLQDTWKELEDALNEKRILTVTVERAVKGGVIAPYKELSGFIPASLLGEGFIKDLSTLVGNTYEVLVVEVIKESNRVIFSRKAVVGEKKEDVKVNKTSGYNKRHSQESGKLEESTADTSFKFSIEELYGDKLKELFKNEK